MVLVRAGEPTQAATTLADAPPPAAPFPSPPVVGEWGPVLHRTPVVGEWVPVLHRTIAGLPDFLLQALIRGLERHSDELVAGRLYAPRGGGCAAGVMLRELNDPSCQRGLGFFVKHGWRTTSRSYKALHKSHPRVRHLEFVFDGAVALLRETEPSLTEPEACSRVGCWMRRAAEDELLARSRGAAVGAPRRA